MVHVEGLSKKFGDHWVLKNLNFSVAKGEALIVRGRNGAGKSTLLRILAGLDSPTKGKVTRDIENPAQQLGYCGLEQAMFAQLTVFEHLELAAEMRGIQTNHESLIRQVGLEDHRDHKASQLSSGLRARLKIALAIQSTPDLLIWDEPGVAMDEAGRALIAEIIEIQKSQGALILATNDPTERRFGTHELILV